MSNQAVLDPPAEPNQEPAPESQIPPEVAAAGKTLSELGVAARQAKRAEARANPPEPDPIQEPTIPQPLSVTDDYTTQRLVRVRAHLERLDDQLEASKTSQDIERIARAIAALSETERKLAGRPDPGSRRPGKERETKDRGEAHPV